MKTIFEHALIVLEKAGDYVSEEDLTMEIHAVFPDAKLGNIFTRLKQPLFIGYDRELGYKWFDWEKVDKKTKELLILNRGCLARGDDY